MWLRFTNKKKIPKVIPLNVSLSAAGELSIALYAKNENPRKVTGMVVEGKMAKRRIRGKVGGKIELEDYDRSDL